MAGPISGSQIEWSLSSIITTGTGTTVLKASPGATARLVVQSITFVLTTAAAQAFTFDDGTTTLFPGPASLAVGSYWLDWGEPGFALKVNGALSYTATAGVALSIAAYGYIIDSSGS